ncbi:hypothetical protein FOA52_013089 [Chlamydomonas sp. UWO 241]|nr:hypothetical protein FOA52_013089 [Chlamydomonas sp. UWO 241]
MYQNCASFVCPKPLATCPPGASRPAGSSTCMFDAGATATFSVAFPEVLDQSALATKCTEICDELEALTDLYERCTCTPVEPAESRRKLHETSTITLTVELTADASTDEVAELLAATSTNNGEGAPSAVCGAGTRSEGSICVADVGTCSTGTVLESGACVIDTSVCPPGTTSGTFQERPACVIGATACSTGTVLENGACVVDASVAASPLLQCGPGTEASCTACEPGYYKISAGSQLCVDCPTSAYLPDPTAAPILCPTGSVTGIAVGVSSESDCICRETASLPVGGVGRCYTPIEYVGCYYDYGDGNGFFNSGASWLFADTKYPDKLVDLEGCAAKAYAPNSAYFGLHVSYASVYGDSQL